MLTDFLLSEPLIWVLIAVIFAVIEGFTMGLTTIWFTVGGVAACIIALLGGPILLQVAVFLIVSIILLYFTRPLAEKRLRIGHEKNNIDQMTGKTCLVMEPIRPYHPGQVKLDGLIWTAAANDKEDILDKGDLARIVKSKGSSLSLRK
jgi:membrane protein implicated in regulation of membrane protease activity